MFHGAMRQEANRVRTEWRHRCRAWIEASTSSNMIINMSSLMIPLLWELAGVTRVFRGGSAGSFFLHQQGSHFDWTYLAVARKMKWFPLFYSLCFFVIWALNQSRNTSDFYSNVDFPFNSFKNQTACLQAAPSLLVIWTVSTYLTAAYGAH